MVKKRAGAGGAARAIAGTVADPTLPKTNVTIGGKVYTLCLDLGALAEAETAINLELARAGSNERVNLLGALPVPNLMNTRVVFAAAVRKFHPEIRFADALKMLTLEDVYAVGSLVGKMWDAAMPEVGRTSDPPQPGT